ncbi:MAG TPA: LysR family transcriptional regulator [Planctomycetota bacterium]|nr:LysR family transcriptional regulator [Planctomycetota bacterium]
MNSAHDEDAVIERIHLDIVRAVDAHGSVTAAARSLHLTQSALSHSIRKLEARLGVALWRREGRAMRPTQAGEHLLALANRLAPQFSHAEERLRQFARGERGTLRIGMECHPCYQWLLKVASPYLAAWPGVDIDVKQKFQFGGIGALFAHDIDVLVTPDPLRKPGMRFVPVFDYEQVLVVGPSHPLRRVRFALPEHVADEVLITYPVPIDRLDIYTRFLTPAGVSPKRHKPIETTDIMLQMVASGRGVAAMPRWLVDEYARKLDVRPVKLGRQGIAKQIFLGFRDSDADLDYLRAFIDLARSLTGRAR